MYNNLRFAAVMILIWRIAPAVQFQNQKYKSGNKTGQENQARETKTFSTANPRSLNPRSLHLSGSCQYPRCIFWVLVLGVLEHQMSIPSVHVASVSCRYNQTALQKQIAGLYAALLATNWAIKVLDLGQAKV